MALTLSISTGQVDLGDTKVLRVTPKDADGAPMAPDTLAAVFTPETGSPAEYALDDFDADGGVYSLHHTFSTAGMTSIVVTATDTGGNSEVEKGAVYVHDPNL